jgi:UDP-N-acetylmuramoyl-tripeptide--D-alanyl-D-alanine ligase
MSAEADVRSSGVISVRFDEIASLALGRLEGEPPDGVVTRIHDDSRRAGPGDLFVAVNSGTRFVQEARSRGAATLVPADQNAALASLAALVRSRSRARVVAVVGSAGKTSTKDMLAALCAGVVPTLAAEESKNNEIGLPLTVLRLEPDTAILVTEMGMRGLGQIDELCAIARPDLALVTNIAAEHLELLGTIENVARANAEAIDALPPGGVAVVPTDAPELARYLRRPDIDVRRFDTTGVTLGESGWSFLVGDERVVLRLPFRQRHMAENTLAALTAYDALGLPLARAQDGAERIVLPRWRGEEQPLPGGGIVVNDAYNANPTSMRAALLDLTERAAGRRRVAILGEMAELGDHADGYHREIGELLRRLGIDVLVAVGERARLYLEPGVAEMRWVERPEAFEDLLRPGDAVLVKASRAVGLEGVPARIAKFAHESWNES